MAESYVDKVANELADLALADQKATGDVGIVDMIGDVLGASSQTLQETYLTAVRVRRAEARARAILADRAGKPFVPDAELIEDLSEPDDTDVEEAEIAPEPEPEATVEEVEQPEDTEAPQPKVGMPRRVTR